MRLAEIIMKKTDTGFGMTQYDSEDFVLAGGFRSGNSGAGTTRLKYMIYDRKLILKDGQPEEVGVVELFVDDKTGMIKGLVNIEIYKQFRKSGYGSRIVKDIKDTAEGDLTIYDIQKKAKKFWDKMGVKYTGRSAKSGILYEFTENTILPMKKPNKYGQIYSKWNDKGWRNKIMRIAQKVIDTYPDACTIKGNWQMKGNPNKDLYGQCGPLSFYLWKALGEPTDFVPYSVMYGEEEHVILYNKKQDVALDIAGNQFDMPFFHAGPGPGYPGGPGYQYMRKIGKKSIVNLEHG